MKIHKALLLLFLLAIAPQLWAQNDTLATDSLATIAPVVEQTSAKKEKSIVNIKDSLTDMILPLMNLDKNVFPENILIPQENIKKLKGELKKTFETETKPLKPLDEK